MEERVQKICKSCHKPFSITKGELDWLKEKGFQPFERCSECRKKRRLEKRKEKATNVK